MTTDPTPPARTPNSNTRVLSWYERQSPAVRAAVVVLVTTALNQLAPWLAPLVRALTGSAPAE